PPRARHPSELRLFELDLLPNVRLTRETTTADCLELEPRVEAGPREDLLTKAVEVITRGSCDPGEQAALSHAGQRIELEDVLVHALGEDHVDASWSAHVECLRGALRQVENTVEPGFADARGEVVF